jgi:hypothetical protein
MNGCSIRYWHFGLRAAQRYASIAPRAAFLNAATDGTRQTFSIAPAYGPRQRRQLQALLGGRAETFRTHPACQRRLFVVVVPDGSSPAVTLVRPKPHAAAWVGAGPATAETARGSMGRGLPGDRLRPGGPAVWSRLPSVAAIRWPPNAKPQRTRTPLARGPLEAHVSCYLEHYNEPNSAFICSTVE